MWWGSLWIVTLAVSAMAIPEPGQLRVPKVYNAVITSNQNLAPSRAYPVIQPVVHRTAIGYVPPPFYYTPIPPVYGGPGVVPLQPGGLGPREETPARPDDVESVEATDGSPPKKISRPKNKNEKDDSSEESSSSEEDDTRASSASDKSTKKEKNDRVPLSFYPNYQSLYYDPYFYPYNAFPPNYAAPGTYYVDYPQPPGVLGPLPPIPPPGVYPIPGTRPHGRPQGRPQGRPDERPEEQPEGSPEISEKESNPRNEKQKARRAEKREKIPDVPPPPLPTATRQNTS